MKKFSYALILATFLHANEVVSMVASVNNEPITNVDIIEFSQFMNIDHNEALQVLIQNKITTSLAKKFKLGANELEINEELAKIAAANHISLEQFVAYNQDKISIIKDNIKDEILKNKLFSMVAQRNMKDVSEEEMVRFYNLNKDKANGASYEDLKEQIRGFLMNKNANDSISNFIEKEKAKASIKMF